MVRKITTQSTYKANAITVESLLRTVQETGFMAYRVIKCNAVTLARIENTLLKEPANPVVALKTLYGLNVELDESQEDGYCEFAA